MMGKYILTTRPTAKHSPAKRVRCLEVINVPVTSLEPDVNFNLSDISDFDPDVAVFTSSYGVDLFFDRFKGNLDSRVTFVSIGSETAKALKKRGKESLIPENKTSEGVVELLSGKQFDGSKIALFVSSKSNGIIQSYMDKNNVNYVVGVLYIAKNISDPSFIDKILEENCLGVVVTSSFEARAIFENIPDNDQKKRICSEKRIFAIGKTTERELVKLGVPVSHPAGKSNLTELLEQIGEKYC